MVLAGIGLILTGVDLSDPETGLAIFCVDARVDGLDPEVNSADPEPDGLDCADVEIDMASRNEVAIIAL